MVYTSDNGRTKKTLTEENYVIAHTVDQTGVRLDAFLKSRYRKRSREVLKKAIESGAITVKRDQSPHLQVGKLKPSTLLISGDEVLVLSEKKPEPEVCFDYRILFEDEHLLVIDKPANLPVHPAGRYFFNTLLVHLRTFAHQTPLKADREFYLAHRIDKETSGVLLIAKDPETCAHIVDQFKARETEKTYLAIVHGHPPEEFEVNLPICRARSSIELKMRTIDPQSLEAQDFPGIQNASTRFKRREIFGDFSLVECFPKTGRQHQIRVHLNAVNHAIVGDKLYGVPDADALDYYETKRLSAEAISRLILPRHALHAFSLSFIHPVTQEWLTFSSPLPKDLQDFIDLKRKLRLNLNIEPVAVPRENSEIVSRPSNWQQKNFERLQLNAHE